MTEELLKKAPYHFDELYNFSLRMAGDYKKAEKLTIKIISEAAKFYDYHKPSDIHKWLLGIAVNTFRKELKTKSENPEDASISYEINNPVNDITTENFFLNINEKDLQELLCRIPWEFRLVVIMKEVLGLDYPGIAALIDIPEGTVIRRLFKGRNIMFKEIMKHK